MHRLFDRAFTAVEAWIERELREEDGLGNEHDETEREEAVTGSGIGHKCVVAGCDACEAEA